MARIGDPRYLQRLQDLLQSRDPIRFPMEVDPTRVGITVAIPADLLFARARRAAPGTGKMLDRALANPAAGADWTLSVPADKTWRVRAAHGRLTSSAAAGQREAMLVLDNGAGSLTEIFVRVNPLVEQGPGQNWEYTWAEGLAQANDVSVATAMGPLPQVFLNAGWRIRTATSSIQAADQWDRLRLLIEEFDA